MLPVVLGSSAPSLFRVAVYGPKGVQIYILAHLSPLLTAFFHVISVMDSAVDSSIGYVVSHLRKRLIVEGYADDRCIGQGNGVMVRAVQSLEHFSGGTT